jgi:leucyl-tRNA synthetase
MSKSPRNVVNPTRSSKILGADAFRLYEMYMGPLEAQKPWSTRDIVGMLRFLNASWRQPRRRRGEQQGCEVEQVPIRRDRPADAPHDQEGRRRHPALRFNTAIAELIKLNNEMGHHAGQSARAGGEFRPDARPVRAAHRRGNLGATRSSQEPGPPPWPTFDPAKLVEDTMEWPVQVNGKLRDKIVVPTDADEQTILQTAESAEKARRGSRHGSSKTTVRAQEASEFCGELT